MESQSRAQALNEVVDSLRRITQAIRLSSSVVQDRLGITGAQLFVLQHLAELPGASLRDLAERTLTDQSSVSVVVSRLVDAGHVVRKISARDARRTELTLTATGRALLRRAPELAQTRLMATLRAVPPARLRVTAGVLGRVARALDTRSGPAQMFFEPAAGKPRAASGRIPGELDRRPAAPARRPGEPDRTPAASARRPAGSSERPSSTRRQGGARVAALRAVSSRRPAASNPRPAASPRRRAASSARRAS